VIDKLVEYKYLDDEAYAKAFVLTYSNKYGKLKLKSMLRAKGVSQEIVDNLLDDMEIESSIESVADKYMRNKVLDDKVQSKLVRFLMSRGYDYDEVKSVVEKYKG
jgi:regulatory protein